jgi:hypothetical protein
MGLFGAAYFQKKHLAFVVPIVSLWLSSLVLDNVVYAEFYSGFQWFSSPLVYVAFAIVIVVGFILLEKVSFTSVLASSLLASAVFFIVSNIGPWLANPLYTKDWNGLMTCYLFALPYFGNTLAGDLFYSGVLFGSFALMRSRFPSLSEAKA